MKARNPLVFRNQSRKKLEEREKGAGISFVYDNEDDDDDGPVGRAEREIGRAIMCTRRRLEGHFWGSELAKAWQGKRVKVSTCLRDIKVCNSSEAQIFPHSLAPFSPFACSR